MTVKPSSKGQLVIPKPIREALGLQKGTRFHVDVVEGKIILEPEMASPIDALYGKYADADLLADLEEEHRRELGDDTTLGLSWSCSRERNPLLPASESCSRKLRPGMPNSPYR